MAENRFWQFFAKFFEIYLNFQKLKKVEKNQDFLVSF